MISRVRVDVFGPARDPRTGGNSLPLKMYFSLNRYLQSSDIGGNIDLHFVDSTTSEIDSYPAAKSMIQRGIQPPLVSINGTVKYTGSIPYEQVYQDIKRLLASR